MAGSKLSAVVLLLLVVVLWNADVSRSQDTGIVRFTNKSKVTTVTIKNVEKATTVPDLGPDGVADFNQTSNSSTVFLFQITNSKTRSLIANLVVPTWTNVSFIDVANFPEVVVAVGHFPSA